MSTLSKETNKLINNITKECNLMINKIELMVNDWAKKAIAIPLCEYLHMNDEEYKTYIYNPVSFLSSKKGLKWIEKHSITELLEASLNKLTAPEVEVKALAEKN